MKFKNKTRLKLKRWKSSSWVFKVIALYWLSFSSPTVAQIIPDTTLTTNSNVTTQGNTNTINKGSRAGNNLFHSFENFSLPTGETAYFNNALDIQNIISRVTGKYASEINGLIRANGTANLFLINPNGIVFGQNAQLNIGGSFLASTANTINFAEGSSFSAKNPESDTLLSVNIPLGLQFAKNSSSINLEGTGHTQFVFSNQAGASITFIGPGESQNGLRLKPGKTFALIGGDVLFNGGIVTTPSGVIEVGSVEEGTVRLIPSFSGWSFSYEGVNNFKDINLAKQSLLDASGFNFGDIHIQGRNINFTDGSLALIANFGSLNSGAIRINAFETLDLTGITSFNATLPFLSPIRLNRGIITTTQSGKGADIVISSNKLIGRNSAIINPLTFGSGNSGNLIINSSKSVEILGQAANETSGISSVFQTASYGSGNAGDVSLSTEKLLIRDGGALQSLTASNGKGGNLSVNALETIKLSGGNTGLILSSSSIETIPFFGGSAIVSLSISSGNASKIDIKTRKIVIENGAAIAASGLQNGNSSTINIDASESVEAIGVGSVNPSFNPTKITSSVGPGDPFITYLYNLKQPPNASSGNVFINTRSLKIADGAQVEVRNNGSGNAGTVNINANVISITNYGGITATTAVGQGGNIDITSKLVRLDNGIISATAGQQGTNSDGGNITVDTDVLFSLGNSTITANAFGGRGGNISINVRDGFLFSSNSLVEASSEFGINGTVQINGLAIDSRGIKAAPEVVQETPEMDSNCQGRSGVAASELVISSRGGFPSSSDEMPDNNYERQNNSVLIEKNNSEEHKAATVEQTLEIVEANAWTIDSNGRIVLIADPNTATPVASALSASKCRQESYTSEVSPTIKTVQRND
ncbi:MAG: filamentous hemagglutinin N-terminal domain-containing protein [Nostoc sp. DedQUE04]|uniref:two-partner secretion domain-containing protein n=1 Tax=Nostoc sp. DedQUE04 TaxID=3075390 RepID=UPI002AD2A8E8|nr:filamentous hemagglutinin N-terminal domain-containing protein [Nostoc sp. DedQUE04]MDZ8139572.1 filamentous hemagglutinin N-terminal domain-containing protein [Nostoc sp. DedQUE04]